MIPLVEMQFLPVKCRCRFTKQYCRKKCSKARRAYGSACRRLGRVLGARFRADEERQIAEAVRESGKARAEWIRDALLSAAQRGVRR